MASPMELDEPSSSFHTPTPITGTGTHLNIQRTIAPNVPSTTKVSDIMANFRPTKLFHREDIKEGRPKPSILSIDFDDPGELCMTSESNETLMIYNVKEGRQDKKLLSQKYGVKLAKFTHASSSVIYASTKENDVMRYLSTHDNSFIRYFEGHTAPVTSISLHPGADNFISCSRDDSVLLWALNQRHWVGKLQLSTPFLSAWDPSGSVFAIASPYSFCLVLYDYRNFTKGPISEFDLVEKMPTRHVAESLTAGWTKLEMSNNGKHILLGTRGASHFLLDAFDGAMKACLRKPVGGTRRAGAGESGDDVPRLEGSGDCCFSPDGRYVLSGSKKDVLVWDTLATPAGEDRILNPTYTLEEQREASVVAFNPRYNMFATADAELMFWLPDPHA